LCLFAGMTAQAADAPGAGDTGADSQVLSTDFLEFLGEGEQQADNDNWLDPLDFDDPKWQSLDDDAERQNDTD